MFEGSSEVSEAPEVKEESLARQHSELRLAPVDPPEHLDMTDPLNHFHMRIVKVPESE
jgi:hypothetical protein